MATLSIKGTAHKLKIIWKRFRGRFSTTLPTGGTDFDKFSSDILNTYALPDRDDFKHAIATMILHMGPQTTRASYHYFAKAIFKSMANQVAYSKMQEIKNKEKELGENSGNGGAGVEGTTEEVVREAS